VSKTLLRTIKSREYKIVAIQLLFVLVIVGILLLFTSLHVGTSALLGGLISVFANFLFARKAFSCTGAQQSHNILKAFYFGEVQKIIITVLAFYIVIKYLNVVFLALFLMYISAQFCFWLAPLLIDIKVWKKNSKHLEQK
jgi:ATP synthase protein I